MSSLYPNHLSVNYSIKCTFNIQNIKKRKEKTVRRTISEDSKKEIDKEMTEETKDQDPDKEIIREITEEEIQDPNLETLLWKESSLSTNGTKRYIRTDYD
jgi:hypothetical protein